MNFLRKLFFSVSFLCFFHGLSYPMRFGEREHASTVKAIKTLVSSFKLGKTFTLREVVQHLPFIKDIRLPRVAKKLLDGVVFSSPKLKETKDSVEITFEAPLLLGQKKAMTARIYSGPNAKGKKFGFTFGIGFPGVFLYKDIFSDMGEAASKLASVLPSKIAKQLKNIGQTTDELMKFANWITFKNASIVLCALPIFNDPVWGNVFTGINVITQVKLGGKLEKLSNFFGRELTTVQFRGLIAPTLNLAGSSISATYVGTVPLLKFSGFELRTSSSTIWIGLEELGPAIVVPWILGSTGLQIKLPGQKDFVNFDGFITIHMHNLDIGGTVGMIENLFAIPGLDLGNLGVLVTVNYMVAAATAGAIPIQGGAITGEIQIGSKRLKLLAKIVPFDPPALPFIVFEGAAEGGLSRSDIIEFALKLASKATKIKGIKIDPSKLKKVFEKVLPPFTIGDHKVLIALRTSVVFGKLYLKGFHIKSSISFAGFGGGLDVSASMGGLKGKLHLDEIKIPKKNPIILISGAGLDGVHGTKDDGPIGFLELSWKNQEMFVDALLSIPLLGIHSATRIDITPQGGMRFDVKHKLGGLFDSELHMEGKPGSLDSFKVSGFLRLELLNKIRSFLVGKMGGLAQKANADLKKANKIAQKEIGIWLDRQVEEFDKKIADLDKKIAVAKKECEESKKDEKKSKIACAKKIQVDFLKEKKKLAKRRRKIKWNRLFAKVAKRATKIISRTTRGALNVARGLLKFTGKVIGGGFNISEIRFEGTLVDLIKKARGMKAFVRGRIAGKPFEQEFQLDLKKLDQLPRQILNAIRQVVSSKRKGQVRLV